MADCRRGRLPEFAPGQEGDAEVDAPEVRYARSGDAHIAYQVMGAGPVDLVVVPGFISHLEHCWEDPGWAALWQRIVEAMERPPGM